MPNHARVLVVDDHLSMAEMVAEGLSEHGYETVAVGSGVEAARLLAEDSFDALVTDLRMPGIDGMTLLSRSRQLAPERPVIIMTAYSAVQSAIESIRQGAYHYLTKPFKSDELALFLGRAIEESRLRHEAAALKRAMRGSLAGIVARSGAMREVCDLVARVADANAPVIILGETGTGKGLVAKALHSESRRADAMFVQVNCAALPENLLESELFGHVKGAFTGATAARVGLMETAHQGTLFLDEIGEMSPALQAKLLNAIESRKIRPVGSNREREVDLRIIAATHRDLRGKVADGSFREDLLYRLEVVTVEIPPLRYRKEDIPMLAEHFLTKAREAHPSSSVRGLAPDALARLLDHSWPGNVRELEHIIERLVLLGRSAEVTAGELPATFGQTRSSTVDFGGTVVPLREMMRRYTAWAFEQLGAQKLLTAEKLGVDIKTLRRWLHEEEAAPGRET